METISEQFGNLRGSSRRLARRLMTIGEGRLELFLLELVEERELFIRCLLVALGIFAFGLLAVLALTAAIVIGLKVSPALILSAITIFYGIIACALYVLLRRMMDQAEPFSATLDQLRKDRASIEIEFS